MSRPTKIKNNGDKYSTENYRNKIITFLTKSGKKPISYKELAAKCRSNRGNSRNFNDALNALVVSGEIYERKRGFVLTDILGYFKAEVLRLNRTFGFIKRCDNQEEIFIPGKYLCGAMPGDKVLAAYIQSRSGSPEGEVVDVLEQALSNLSGIIIEESGNKYFLADSMSKTPVRIVPGDAVYKVGDKVLAQIIFRGKRHAEHKAKIIFSFGSALKASSCAEAVISESGVIPEFPENVLFEAKKIAASGVWEDDFKNRLDLRDKLIFTVDSAESKDLDDAVSLEKIPAGYRLGVHIADVSHYVKGNSQLDKEALERGTSIYYADKVIPMLPKELSNGICSLNPNESRLTFSAIMELSKDGILLNYKFVKSVICSKVKGIYSEINSILDGSAEKAIEEKYFELKDTIFLMDELADILILNRRKRGAPEIETSESKLIIDNGMCREIVPRTRGKSEMIIEEFMLTANEAAARTAHENDIPFVYRVHEAPSPEKINDLKEGLRRLNVEVPVFTEAKPVHLSEILRNSKDKPFYPVINMMTLRSMAKAKYEPEPKGHFGLALDDYAHFTSPIRRYPDLAIHRILTDIINGYDKEKLIKRYSGFVQKASQRSTETEIRAMNIERIARTAIKRNICSSI